MTLNSIAKKLIKNNKGQYVILISSIIFAVMMIGGYGVIQFSPTVTDVLMDGGSTQMISLTMFGFTVIGTFVFVMYAHSLFLKHKSKEIGIFISLGIKRENVKKIVLKELTIVAAIATIIGLLLAVPVSYLSWTSITFFLSTAETTYKFGWIGFFIGAIFAMVSMINVTSRYIKKVDIMKILKATEEVEELKGDSFTLGIIGTILIPVGIILFTISSKITALSDFALIFLVLSLIGLYLLIVQITSIGSLVKKIKPIKYYKNLVFFNLIKLKGKQYSKTLFVSTILTGISIFGTSFNVAPLMDRYLKALNEPYDYVVLSGEDQKGYGESDIVALAEKYKVGLKDFKSYKSIRMGIYHDDVEWRGATTLVSEDEFNKISGENINVKEGTFIEFNSMDDKFKKDFEDDKESTKEFINGTTQERFTLQFSGTLWIDKVLANEKLNGKGFLIVDNDDYDRFEASLDDIHKINIYMFNVENWRESEAFSDALFNDIVKASDNKWCSNFQFAPVYELNKKEKIGEYEFVYEEVNEKSKLMAKKWWSFAPISKYNAVYNSVSDFAIYLLLMIYIAIIAFVSAIMVIGIKILNTMWQDKSIYKNIIFLGTKRDEIKSIVTKQVMLIYFVPLVLGTIISLFLLRQMLVVTGLEYMNVAVGTSCALALIILIVQIIIFFFIRNKAVKDATDFHDEI